MRAIGSIWTATFSFMARVRKLLRWDQFVEWRLMKESGARVERCQQMPRKPSRRNQHGIKTQIEIGMFGMRHQPGLCSRDDANLLARGGCVSCLLEARAGIELDERHQMAPTRYNVHLAIRRAIAFSQVAITLCTHKSS